jgi:hypothetical protein
MATSDMVLMKSVGQNLAKTAADAGNAAFDEDASGPVAAGLDEATMAVATDAGAPPDLLIPDDELARAVQMLAAGVLTQRKVIDLIKTVSNLEAFWAGKRGHRRGVERAVELMRRGAGPITRAGPEQEVHWRRSRGMQNFRYDIIERYKAIHGGQVDQGVGYYFGTVQVPLTVEGTITDAAFVLSVPPPNGPNVNPVIDTCFDLAIGDTEQNWFGGPHVLDPSDTNLQNPGQNIYPDEVFIIEAVATRLKAIRISYPTGDFPTGSEPGAPGPVTLNGLTGAAPVWDRAGRIVPIEVFNQFDDTVEIAQAVAEVSTLYFNWLNRGVGGNVNVNTKLIERMNAVPGAARRGVQETAGGAMSLDLERGFLWLLDKQFQATEDEGGNGLFNAQLNLMTDVVFPFQPLQLFSSTGPVLPTGFALEWQFTLWGTSLLPAKVDGGPGGRYNRARMRT